MRRLPAFGIAFAFVATLVVAGSARADPITITSGTITQGGSAVATFNLSGAGFNAQGRDQDRDFDSAPLGLGGGVLSVNNFGNDFPTSQLTLGGKAFSNVWVDGSFKVNGRSLSGDDRDGDRDDLEREDVPFQMTGTLSGFQSINTRNRGESLFTQTFTGQGTAHVDLSAAGGPAVVFEFSGGAPNPERSGAFGGAASVVTPEPASLLLLGSGLVISGIRARSRKR